MNKKMPSNSAFQYDFGYYFGQIRVSYFDENELYIGGLNLYKSKNGGKTLQPETDKSIHVDIHAIWLNPSSEEQIFIGSDGGVNYSENNGKTWQTANHAPITQFYSLNTDNQTNYNIFGGTQDNGTLYGNIFNKNTVKDIFSQLSGGDGMHIQIDPNHKFIVYGYQYGNYFKSNLSNSQSGIYLSKLQTILPQTTVFDAKLRFGWQTPILLSQTQKNILYIGANRLIEYNLATLQTKLISPDLTNGGEKGCTPFGSLFTISISPFSDELIYTGSDDGLIFRTDDKGKNWQKLNQNMPEKLKITKVLASKYNQDRVFAAISGYSFDNTESFLYFSLNKGNDWQKIGSNLPKISILTIAEDPFYENIMYVGTNLGLFISIDFGKYFYIFNQIPTLPITEIVFNKTHNHLLISTFGRSIFLADLKGIYKAANL
jgi:ligand-binding sensor domain-containing protein